MSNGSKISTLTGRAGWAAMIAFVSVCWVMPQSAQAAMDSPAAPAIISARLTDQQQELPGGLLAWSTVWGFCWQPDPEAAAYELQPISTEGELQVRKLQVSTCFQLEVAKGTNKAAQGMLNRDLLLAIQSGQLSYHVRSVMPDGSMGAWSQLIQVGTTKGGAATKSLAPKSLVSEVKTGKAN